MAHTGPRSMTFGSEPNVSQYCSSKNLLLTLLTLLSLLLVGGLTNASACLQSGKSCARQCSAAATRVNDCHPETFQKLASSFCCQSESCHRSAALPRALGGPEYRTQSANAHLLIHDSRPLTPQLRSPVDLACLAVMPEPRLFYLTASLAPLQSLSNLRTVILRH